MGCPAVGYSVEEDGVRVHLESGSTIEAGLLVGADGIRSRIRQLLLGDGPPDFAGYTSIRGVSSTPPDFPGGVIAYGRGASVFMSPVDAQRSYWVVSLVDAEGTWPNKTPADAHREVLDRLAGWDPRLRGAIEATALSTLVLTDVHDRDPTPIWHEGPVVLLGDAAHPMTYMMGQGANTALEDAVVLAAHLARSSDLDEALVAYTEERAPRTSSIVKQSRMFGKVGHATSWAGCIVRDGMMWAMGKLSDPDRQNRDVFGWRPPALGGTHVER